MYVAAALSRKRTPARTSCTFRNLLDDLRDALLVEVSCEVGLGNDADEPSVFLDDGQPPNVMLPDQTQRLVKVLLRVDRDQVRRGDLFDLRDLRIATLGDDANRDVAVGDHADEPVTVDDRGDPAVLASHQLRRLHDRVACLDGPGKHRHQLPDLSHGRVLSVRSPAQTIHGRLSVVRRATENDAELLASWHGDPEVSRYWDEETFTVQEIRERLARPDVDAWIIESNGAPVGYLQSWWEADTPTIGGIDGFLIPSARGRGIMPDAGRALAEALLAENWESVTVDPYAWNAHAIRGWQKAGFVEVSRHDPDEEHIAEWVLMRFEPQRPT